MHLVHELTERHTYIFDKSKMQASNVFTIIAALIVAVAGYFVFNKSESGYIAGIGWRKSILHP